MCSHSLGFSEVGVAGVPGCVECAYSVSERWRAHVSLAPQDEIARTVGKEPGRLRHAGAPAVLALLGAAALVPVLIEAAGGGPLAAALGGVAGNVGGGYLTGVLERMAYRLRDGQSRQEPDEIRDRLAADLLTALQKNDHSAGELRSELTTLLVKVDGFEAAVSAATGDLQTHLVSCISELVGQQSEALRRLAVVDARQRRQERQQRDQARQTREMLDRLRLLTRRAAEGPVTAEHAPLGVPWHDTAPARPAMIVNAAAPAPATGVRWQGGEEIAVGDRVYLLHGFLLAEYFDAAQSVLFRQARGLQLISPEDPGQELVWLRQAEVRQRGRDAQHALAALPAERQLLAALGSHRGLPRTVQLEADEGRAFLALAWPTSQAGRPCETIGTAFGSDAAPMDSWQMFRLFTGLAGLTGALDRLHGRKRSHRALEPAAVIVLDDGSFVLRDLGLAAREYEPGEGPAGYQAPEQLRGARGQPGPGTDVYQLAAVAYHLITGYPPHARTPLPLASQRQDVPERVSLAIDAALAAGITDRPGTREFGDTLRSARDDLC
jgi:hypothetical protein